MTHPSDIAGLSERLRDGYAHKRPFPLNRVDRGRVVAPIYAIHDDDLRELLSEIDALTARVKELEATVAIRERAISESARSIHKIMTRAVQAESRAARLQQQRDEAYERAANVAEQFGEPYALNANTGAMMFRAVTEKIAATIRRLASGPEGGEKPQEPTS